MIENTVASVVYTADGAQTQWTIPFSYGHVEDVKLFVKVGTADIAPVSSNLYSIDTELNTITYPLSGDPLAANDKVIVMRVTEQTQEESSVLLSFKSEDIERMADKLTMEVQELQEQLSRCIAFNPVDAAEGEVDAQKYIDDLTDLKDTATTQAGIATSAATTATTQAGLASAAKTAAETAQDKAEKWAEGTDAQVAALGGTHSAEGWAGIAQTAAESENVQTVIANMSDINSVADNITDVTTVSNISAAVSNVADNDTEVLLVSDNMASVITTASNINNVNTVAGVSTKVSTVADNISDVGTVADNISDVGTVANVSTAVSTVANDINAIKAVNNNKTNIDAVATNQSNINAVASNATNINAVNANKTNIDAVAGNATNINTVATNISDVNDVADDITKVSAVADDLTAINAVNSNKTNIDTVATNISDVNTVGQAIEDVSAVADNLTGINLVANDLENIDAVATNVAEWQKPEDWVDIRSGALDNSVYLLVAHSAPTESGGVYTVATYPKFIFYCTVSNTSHTYDIYVDGIKITSPTSGSNNNYYTIDWGALYTAGTVQTIYTTTHPSSLVYHVIRLTPTDSTDTLTRFRNFVPSTESAYSQQGIMWVHYELSNSINISSSLGGESRPRNTLLEAVTAKNDKITYTVAPASSNSGFYNAFCGCSSLVQIPILEAENQTYASGVYLSFFQVPARKVIIRNNKGEEQISLISGSEVKEFDVENGVSPVSGTTSWQQQANSTKLIKLPSFSKYITSNEGLHMQNLLGLQPTVFDDSNFHGRTKLIILGTNASNFVSGLKGLVVSNQAPFDGTSPQINVKYTGLNRQALVNLFNSMPYNVGYTVVGSPTITDGVVSDFTNSSYLSIGTYTGSSPSTLEMGVTFTTADTIRRSDSLFGRNSTVDTGLFFRGGADSIAAKYRVSYDNGNSWTNVESASSYTLSANTTYTAIMTISNVTRELVLKIVQNGEVKDTVTTTFNESAIIENPTSIGIGKIQTHNNFTGSIYLNNTYIKVNGVPWFTGKAAMTKTCSVVGCTGTADLTADDKAICTGKGWELTVA